MKSAELTVRFWGVRGSIACPGAETLRYGGNTSCVEVRCGEKILIFDGGTGLRRLGNALSMEDGPREIALFYSHTHLDHIIGLPFFAPCYDPRYRIRIWSGHLEPPFGIKAVLKKMMAAPFFPIPLGIFAARLEFVDFAAGDEIAPHPGVRLSTAPLNHPNGATGYRLDYGGKSVAYLTDTEHRPEGHDPQVARLAAGADLMIYDAAYTDAEYPAHKDWGHSTWQEGVRLAEASGARRLVLFHHDPGHDDAFLDEVAAAAAARRPGTLVAREGMVLCP